MEQLSIDVARSLRDVGIARTLEAEPETWLDGALHALRTFASQPGWQEFKVEDFRAWYALQGLPQPHSHKVWGGFTQAAERGQIIRWTGRFAQAVSPKTHAHWVKTWQLNIGATT